MINNTIQGGFQQPPFPRVERVRTTFGYDTILIPTRPGTKEPFQKGYPGFGIEKMSDPEHLALLEKSNIAILTGSASGNLISIDFDDDGAYEEFRILNPHLCETRRTIGARGCNLWYRISGEYPKGIKKLWGRRDSPVGELRAGDCITVVDGKHPKGMEYRIDTQFLLRIISFEDIRWPADWSGITEKVDPFDELTRKHGPPMLVGERGTVQLNEAFIGAWIRKENHLAFAKEDERFYMYDEAAGIWPVRSAREVDRLIHDYIARLASENELDRVHFQNRSGIAASIRNQLAALSSQAFFVPFRADGWIAFPANNTVVAVIPASSEVPENLAAIQFEPSYRFVAKSEVDFVAGVGCPRFLGELLCPVLQPDDILLLQKMVGLALVGENDVQKFLLLEGKGDLGKGVLVRVIQKVMGGTLTTELRTRHLEGRFETSRFLGKRLLLGHDVQADFLNTKSASLLKALTGGDSVSTEAKGSNGTADLNGRLHVFITSNAPLLVRVEADASAWRRRLVIIPFHPPAGVLTKRIPRFEDVLIREEGPGILNWMLRGALAAWADIRETGTIRTTPEQSRRVEDRVRASDTVGVFVEERLSVLPEGGVASQTLWEAYLSFCRERGFAAVVERVFLTQIRGVMEARWGGHVQATENLIHNGVRCRGYRGVGVLPPGP